ncbi:MAG: glycosyltransferase [Chitinophagales bacterium]
MSSPIAPTLLICITHSFPFGIGDDHLEDELKVLSEMVDEVIIVSRSHFKEQTRTLPLNVKIIRIPFKISISGKLKALTQIDWKVLRAEIKFIKINFKRLPSLAMYRNIFGSLLISTDLKRNLIPIIDQYADRGYTIHLYSYWNDLSAVALALLKKKYPAINACSRAHAFEIYDERHAMNYIPFQKIKFDSLNRIFFVSSFGLKYIQQRFPSLKFDRCSLSWLGCFEMPGISYRKKATVIRIISIGYNYAIKRIELLAKSLSIITGLEVQWFHVGDAMHDKEYYEKMVKELISGIPSVHVHLTGNLNHNQLARLYASTPFDLLINVSPLEGVPVSMMECMSAGIPVVATAVGGVPEIVKHEVNGILLPPNPLPEEVAVALQNFHSKSETEIMEFRRNARKTWEEQYNAGKNYPEFAKELLVSPSIS